jgi:hypothetical protein
VADGPETGIVTGKVANARPRAASVQVTRRWPPSDYRDQPGGIFR